MYKTIALAFILIYSGASAAELFKRNLADDDLSPTEEVSVKLDGVERTYLVYSPNVRDINEPLPVIFSFHSFGSTSKKQVSMTGMSRLAESRQFIIVYPDGLKNKRGKQFWNTQLFQNSDAEIRFVKYILERLSSTYNIDSNNIFATGISNGGGMANLLAAKMSNTFSAIAPVAGAYYDFEAFTPSKSVSIMAFHGTRDRVVPYKGRRKLPNIHDWINFWVKRNGCDSIAKRTDVAREVFVETWGECESEVILYTIKDKGHSWPGSNMPKRITTKQIDASKLMLKFFLDLQKIILM